MATQYAPACKVFTSDGERIDLASLYRDGVLALVFLRHLGCVFCLEQILALNPHTDINVAFVCMATPEEAREYKAKWSSPHRFLCDPDEDLFREMGLANATRAQVFTVKTLTSSVVSAMHGRFNHRSKSNMARLGGAFLITPDGEVAWSRLTQEVSDIISGREIRTALASLGAKKS